MVMTKEMMRKKKCLKCRERIYYIVNIRFVFCIATYNRYTVLVVYRVPQLIFVLSSKLEKGM